MGRRTARVRLQAAQLFPGSFHTSATPQVPATGPRDASARVFTLGCRSPRLHFKRRRELGFTMAPGS
jgi:hypothetical protein